MDAKTVRQHPVELTNSVHCPEGDAIFTMCSFRFKNYLLSKPFISGAWINFLLLLLLTHPRPILVHFSPLVPSFLSLSIRRMFDFTRPGCVLAFFSQLITNNYRSKCLPTTLLISLTTIAFICHAPRNGFMQWAY